MAAATASAAALVASFKFAGVSAGLEAGTVFPGWMLGGDLLAAGLCSGITGWTRPVILGPVGAVFAGAVAVILDVDG
jgi:hypothetical protein